MSDLMTACAIEICRWNVFNRGIPRMERTEILTWNEFIRGTVVCLNIRTAQMESRPF